MRWLVPCLSAVAIVGIALVVTVYQADHPPKQAPTAPNLVVQIADWHWTPDDECSPEDRGDYLEMVETIQQQQMAVIRDLEVRDVWIEGQSDQTIDEFRRHILKLRGVKPPADDSDNPVNQLIADIYREDLLSIGAAGRLLLAGEIDEVLPLEDHKAWRAAQPVNCQIDPAANEARERAMAKRLPSRAVIVLGVGHDLSKLMPKGVEYLLVKVEALPGEK